MLGHEDGAIPQPRVEGSGVGGGGCGCGVCGKLGKLGSCPVGNIPLLKTNYIDYELFLEFFRACIFFVVIVFLKSIFL